ADAAVPLYSGWTRLGGLRWTARLQRQWRRSDRMSRLRVWLLGRWGWWWRGLAVRRSLGPAGGRTLATAEKLSARSQATTPWLGLRLVGLGLGCLRATLAAGIGRGTSIGPCFDVRAANQQRLCSILLRLGGNRGLLLPA